MNMRCVAVDALESVTPGMSPRTVDANSKPNISNLEYALVIFLFGQWNKCWEYESTFWARMRKVLSTEVLVERLVLRDLETFE